MEFAKLPPPLVPALGPTIQLDDKAEFDWPKKTETLHAFTGPPEVGSTTLKEPIVVCALCVSAAPDHVARFDTG